MSAEHIISRQTNKKGSCICLWKQDLSTEIHQLKDQLIFILIERQKSACSTPQGRTGVRPQRVVTEQPSHLRSFHLFLNHAENLLTQRAKQAYSQHLASEKTWMRSNALVCLFPFCLPGTRNPSRWAPSQPPVPTGRAVTTEGASKPGKKGFSTSYRNSLRPREQDL